MRNLFNPSCCCFVCRDFYLPPEDFTLAGGGSPSAGPSGSPQISLTAGQVAVYDGLLPTDDEAYRLQIKTLSGGDATVWLDYEVDGAGDPVDGTGIQTAAVVQDGVNPKSFVRTPEWIYDQEVTQLRFYDVDLPPKNGRLRITASVNTAVEIRYQTATISFADGGYGSEPTQDCGIRWAAICDLSAIAAVANSQCLVDSGFEVVRLVRRSCNNPTDAVAEADIQASDGDPPGTWTTKARIAGNVAEPSFAEPYPRPGWIMTFTGATEGTFDLGETGLSGGGSFSFLSSPTDITWQFLP